MLIVIGIILFVATVVVACILVNDPPGEQGFWVFPVLLSILGIICLTGGGTGCSDWANPAPGAYILRGVYYPQSPSTGFSAKGTVMLEGTGDHELYYGNMDVDGGVVGLPLPTFVNVVELPSGKLRIERFSTSEPPVR